MKKIIENIHSIALIGSLGVLVFVGAFFWIKENPPKVTNVFSSTRPGVLYFDVEKPISVNNPFRVKVEIDSQKQAVNAVGLYLNFDPKKLQVIDFDTTKSFCQFYPEKKFDNQLGTISLACGAPHPGVSSINTLLEIKFMPLEVGSVNLYTDPTSLILLSNGKGTNILEDTPVTQLVINNYL